MKHKNNPAIEFTGHTERNQNADLFVISVERKV
jgi:hypothetical protein